MWATIALAVTAVTPAPAASPPPLTIGTFRRAIDFAPFYGAEADGCLAALAERHGRTVKTVVYETIPALNAAVTAGALDIVLEADTPAIAQRAAGIELTPIAPIAALSQQLLVPAGSPVRRLADLAGRRVGVLKGSGYHFALVDGLTAAGVAPDRYGIVDVTPTAGAAMLASGAVDAWAIWPPELQEARRATRVIAGSPETLNVYAFAAGRSLAAEPDIAIGFAGCMRRSIAAIARRPAAAIALTARETALDPQIVAAAWPTMAFGFRVDPATIRVLNAQAAFLHAGGYVRRPVRFDAREFRGPGFAR